MNGSFFPKMSEKGFYNVLFPLRFQVCDNNNNKGFGFPPEKNVNGCLYDVAGILGRSKLHFSAGGFFEKS